MTYNGWLEPLNELIPRITTELEPPGLEEAEEICTPATLPAKPETISPVRFSCNSSPFTAVAEKPMAFSERLIPIAVTTTSSRFCVSDFIRILTFGATCTVCFCIPI